MSKIILIGQHPKGYPVPFHIKTRSGKILRNMLKRNKINAVVINLWKNQEQKEKGAASQGIIERLYHLERKKYFTIIGLGKKVSITLNEYGIEHICLPHPACRSKKLLQKLENKLIEINST